MLTVILKSGTEYKYLHILHILINLFEVICTIGMTMKYINMNVMIEISIFIYKTYIYIYKEKDRDMF